MGEGGKEGLAPEHMYSIVGQGGWKVVEPVGSVNIRNGKIEGAEVLEKKLLGQRAVPFITCKPPHL